ncbi:MAG: YceI family protein [Myxococcota bacterium]
MRGWFTGALMMGTLAASLAPTSAMAEDKTYSVTGGRLEVMVKYDRNALIGGHDHILESTSFSGSVTVDPANPAGCKINLSMPVNTLSVDPAGARSRRGLEGTTSDGDKKSILKNALSKGQLNGEAHPNITFASTSCAPAGDKIQVNGNLTIRGVSKPVSTKIKVTADGASFRGTGWFSTSHATFGFKPYSALLGSLRNAEELTMWVDVKGQ